MTDQIKPGDIEVLLRFREMMGRWPDAGPEDFFTLPSEEGQSALNGIQQQPAKLESGNSHKNKLP